MSIGRLADGPADNENSIRRHRKDHSTCSVSVHSATAVVAGAIADAKPAVGGRWLTLSPFLYDDLFRCCLCLDEAAAAAAATTAPAVVAYLKVFFNIGATIHGSPV